MCQAGRQALPVLLQLQEAAAGFAAGLQPCLAGSPASQLQELLLAADGPLRAQMPRYILVQLSADAAQWISTMPLQVHAVSGTTLHAHLHIQCPK